jgi:N-acetylglucosaminyldiphosphoundecaprenol N-acetyl-beta-D-mannosaminyltransferase
VWVGFGTPKQDKWIALHVGKIHAAAFLGVEAAFNFVSEMKPRAPLWMQRFRLKWLFRLTTVPRRLAPRYLVIISVFMVCTPRQLTGWKILRSGLVRVASRIGSVNGNLPQD